jgi:hypothetical protein
VNLKEGDLVPQSMTLMGHYPPGFTGELWVFVRTSSGRLYPQSPNACEGKGTPRVGDRWEVRVGFGDVDDEGALFWLILATANPAGHQEIANNLRQSCGDYPGMTALPSGVTAQGDPIRVTRSAMRWGSAPAITNAQLPGAAVLTNTVDGEQVPQEKNLEGAYNSDVVDQIWVLVHAPNGRWYPQSAAACDRVGVLSADGRWHVRAGFGGSGNVGEPFDIAVVLADPVAHDKFLNKQKEWCDAGDHEGFLTIDLPPGISEKDRVRVFRK